MTDTKIVSVNLPEELVEYVDERSDNRSAFLTKLLENHRDSKSVANEAVAEFRKRQLKQKKAALESELELFEDELEDINKTLESSEAQTAAELAEAREALKDTPKDATNPAVKNWAEDLGMSPAELLSELEDGDGE